MANVLRHRYGRQVEPSDELRVLARPFRGYRALMEDAHLERARPWQRPLITLLVIGAFGSVTTAGRFVVWHVLLIGLAWSFIPAAQLVWLAVARRGWGRAMPLGRSIHLFFAGQGGWLAVLLAVSALVTWAPSVADRLTGGRWILVLGAPALVTALHGVLVTYAFMREVWALPLRRALAATGTYYLGLIGTIISYYLVMGQLVPLLSRTQ